jgi:hypothetical protein
MPGRALDINIDASDELIIYWFRKWAAKRADCPLFSGSVSSALDET